MPDDVAISVEHISKDFILPHEKVTTVKGLFTSALRRRKTKDVQHALHDVSFEIRKGEFFGIVGRNGSGKSTMLKMLAGIYQPTKGKIAIKGKLVPFIELGVGFNPELTGRENVYLNGAMMGFSHKETDAMYDDIVAFAELEDFMDQKLKNYSSGMQVRLAFSVAVKAEADILLVDEVLAVGDADFQRKCFDYFRKLKNDKKTVVFVSHDMSAVREFCDRAALLEASQLVATDKASTIASKYSRLFIQESEPEDEQPDADASNSGRWGDGSVKAEKVTLRHDVLTDDSTVLKLTTTLKAIRDTENVVTGFTIRDGFGTEICGTNTQIKGVKLPHLRVGESLRVEWECANIFADGQHTVDVSVHGVDGATVHDWWEGAARFTSKRSEKTAYRVLPPITVAVGSQSNTQTQ